MPLIKRYPNRKLYDTEAKSYITLEQITDLIRQGGEVQVIDHESGEDLTSLTLTQIIMEQEKKRTGSLPRTVLTSLIRTGGNTLDQLVQVVGSGLNLRAGSQELEAQLEKLLTQGKLSLAQAHALVDVDARVADVLHRLNVPTHNDIERLHGQVAALNEMLAELLAQQNPSSATRQIDAQSDEPAS